MFNVVKTNLLFFGKPATRRRTLGSDESAKIQIKKIRSAVKLESLGDWCCLIKNKLILMYSAVMIGTQTCSQMPMNPRYIQY